MVVGHISLAWNKGQYRKFRTHRHPSKNHAHLPARLCFSDPDRRRYDVDDWAGCPEGTKFDSYIKSRADIGSNRPCDNGLVRSNFQYVEGRLPYPVCCAPIGRGRRAAFAKEADALHEKAPETKGTWQKA